MINPLTILGRLVSNSLVALSPAPHLPISHWPAGAVDFDEIHDPSSADRMAHSGGPLAEDSPAGPELRAHSPAGHPILTRDDYMDAANAVNHMVKKSPAFQPHWLGLQQRLEAAAIAASK